jgi:hypothetical protein
MMGRNGPNVGLRGLRREMEYHRNENSAQSFVGFAKNRNATTKCKLFLERYSLRFKI